MPQIFRPGADEITNELRRIVEFVNTHTSLTLEFLAIEIGFLSEGGVDVILPTTYGEEAASNKRSQLEASGRERYYAELRRLYSSAFSERVLRFVEAFEEQGVEMGYGGTPATSSASARFTLRGKALTLWNSYVYPKHATLEVNFPQMSSAGVSREHLTAMVAQLSSIPELQPVYSEVVASDFRRRPSVAMDRLLLSEESASTFIAAFEDLLSSQNTEDASIRHSGLS